MKVSYLMQGSSTISKGLIVNGKDGYVGIFRVGMDVWLHISAESPKCKDVGVSLLPEEAARLAGVLLGLSESWEDGVEEWRG